MSKKALIMVTGTLLCAIFMAGIAGAQERVRNAEFSVAGSMQAYVGEQETEHYISLPIRIGAFVTPNVLLELEGIATGWDEAWSGDTEFGYVVSLNGSYNVIVAENLMPFFLLGIGFSNGLPLANAVAIPDDDGPKPLVLNAGAGMKFLFSPMAALRIEYRLQDFSGEQTEQLWYGTYTDRIDVTVHSMFFGVSLFF